MRKIVEVTREIKKVTEDSKLRDRKKGNKVRHDKEAGLVKCVKVVAMSWKGK